MPYNVAFTNVFKMSGLQIENNMIHKNKAKKWGVDDDPQIEKIKEQAFLEGQSRPRIKQLEWVEYENPRGQKSYFAETPLTPYEIADGGGYYVMSRPGKMVKFKSADGAKAFAQQDFEARVKECLITE